MDAHFWQSLPRIFLPFAIIGMTSDMESILNLTNENARLDGLEVITIISRYFVKNQFNLKKKSVEHIKEQNNAS